MPSWLQDVVALLVVFGIVAGGVYSFTILPRQREYKRRMKVVQELKVGTEVLTYGGLIGTIKRIDYDTGVVYVEVAPGMEFRFIAASITQEFDAKAYAASAKEHMK